MENKGFEFLISSTNISQGDLTWTTDFNITKQSIKVNKLPNGDDVQYQRMNASNQPLLKVGLPYSEIGLQLEEWLDL